MADVEQHCALPHASQAHLKMASCEKEEDSVVSICRASLVECEKADGGGDASQRSVHDSTLRSLTSSGVEDDDASVLGASSYSERSDDVEDVMREDANSPGIATTRRRKRKKPQDLKACMQSMKGQVVFLQTMMEKIAVIEKERRLSGHHEDSFGDVSGLSFSSLSPVRKSSVDVIALPDAHFKKEMLFLDNWDLDHGEEHGYSRSSSRTESTSRLDELERENAVLRAQIARYDEESDGSVTKLLAEVEGLTRRIRSTEDENERLRSAIQEFEQNRARAAQDVVAESTTSRESSIERCRNQDDHVLTHIPDEKVSAQSVDEQEQATDMNLVHKNHERCQEKIHELWQTVKTLKVYVETFRIEKDDMRMQRDEAIASAERAWKDNAKLAGNTNPQQKIKYLQAVKDENAALVKKIRDLQSQLAAKHAKRAVKKASLFEPQDSQSDLSASFDESLLECDGAVDDVEPERSTLFRKMWHHNKELEAEIQRLRDDKRALVARRSRSASTESNCSARSSGSNNSSKTSRRSDSRRHSFVKRT